MGGTVLGTSESERDIGVTVDHNLKPSVQCKKAAQTARQCWARLSGLSISEIDISF